MAYGLTSRIGIAHPNVVASEVHLNAFRPRLHILLHFLMPRPNRPIIVYRWAQPAGRVQGGSLSELLCRGQLSGGGVRVRGGGPEHHALTPEPTQQFASLVPSETPPLPNPGDPPLVVCDMRWETKIVAKTSQQVP
ncbi:hypothetical protein E1301_Tti009797 [Triplophysa tibetana]|uniref:Uncharacterized protein n=1 Tax=Triplophysa tibetana TaxID=1572043 RepID=A0A5A9N7X7_9TELE|nr:hypothetical protein E1301_Tti009797 [Triplophysa tibetana]